MPQTKRASKRKHPKKAVSVVGVVGASLSLAGGASAATAVPTADVPSWDTAPPQITLNEEEIADVSLGTFYVFDKENAGTPRFGEKYARRCGGCRGCRGCAVRRCGGCGGGCGGCGCGGCGCCLSWGVCRIC
jgi:heterocycloanthracin/sonorensin family bacteriocin